MNLTRFLAKSLPLVSANPPALVSIRIIVIACFNTFSPFIEMAVCVLEKDGKP